MLWHDCDPEVRVEELAALLRSLDFWSAIYLLVNLDQGIWLYASPSCLSTIDSHISTSDKELGGLILGRVFRYHAPLTRVVILTKAVPSRMLSNTHTSLEMGNEVWNDANRSTQQGELIVGWYHSHPNLGAFFSSTDKHTQHAIFHHDYSVGLVIDPFREERKVFVGIDSQEYGGPILPAELPF